jgi:hypothetical protein
MGYAVEGRAVVHVLLLCVRSNRCVRSCRRWQGPELIKWYAVLDRAWYDHVKGLKMARESHHPDAVWLSTWRSCDRRALVRDAGRRRFPRHLACVGGRDHEVVLMRAVEEATCVRRSARTRAPLTPAHLGVLVNCTLQCLAGRDVPSTAGAWQLCDAAW